MKLLTFLILFVLVTPVLTQTLPAGRIIDLSYPFDADTVYWPTAETFKLEKDFEGVTDKGYYYSAYRYSAAEHGGTHLDAPVHFAKGRNTVDQIPLEQLIGSGLVIDVTSKCASNLSELGETKWQDSPGQHSIAAHGLWQILSGPQEISGHRRARRRRRGEAPLPGFAPAGGALVNAKPRNQSDWFGHGEHRLWTIDALREPSRIVREGRSRL